MLFGMLAIITAIILTTIIENNNNKYDFISEDGIKCNDINVYKYYDDLLDCEDGYNRYKANNYKKVLKKWK